MEKIIKKIIKKAEENKVDAVLNISSTKTLSVDYNRDKLQGSAEGNSTMLEIRLSKGSKYSYSTTNLVNDWERCFNKALKIVKVSKPLKHKILLAEPKKLKPADGIYSKKVSEMPIEELYKKAAEAVSEVKNVRKELSVFLAKFTKEEEETFLANSNGVYSEDKTTTIGGFVQCGTGTITGVEESISHSDFDFAKIGRNAAELCVQSLNPKPVKTMKSELILDYFAASELLQATLVPAVSAENVQNNRSFLKNKIGRKVFSDKITIYDDGLLAKGLESAKTDEEGTPSQRTEIFSRGVLKNYIYDLYSAGKDGKKTTGNCASIEKVPSVGVSNFVLAPGKYSRDEIIKETDEGVIASQLMGTHLINTITGDASLGLANAFYVEKGEIKYPIKQAMIFVNVFEALKGIEMIGNNLRQESAVMCPTIKLPEVQITS